MFQVILNYIIRRSVIKAVLFENRSFLFKGSFNN